MQKITVSFAGCSAVPVTEGRKKWSMAEKEASKVPEEKVSVEKQEEGSPPGNRRFLKIGGIVIAVLVVTLFVVYAGLEGWFHSGKPAPEQAGAPVEVAAGQEEKEDKEIKDAESAEVLPQTARDTADFFDRARAPDPFAGPLVLSGIITGGGGSDLAIIQTAAASYVVSEGDIVDEYWTVDTISSDGVLLKAEEREVALKLTGGRNLVTFEGSNGENGENGEVERDEQ